MAQRSTNGTIIGISSLYLFIAVGLIALGSLIQNRFGFFPPTLSLIGAALVLIAGVTYFSKSLLTAYLMSAILALGLIGSILYGLGRTAPDLSANFVIFAALWLGVVIYPVILISRPVANTPTDENLLRRLFSLPNPQLEKAENRKAANQ